MRQNWQAHATKALTARLYDMSLRTSVGKPTSPRGVSKTRRPPELADMDHYTDHQNARSRWCVALSEGVEPPPGYLQG